MADKESSVLLVGGPDAGKSNFLFRFWIAVDQGAGALAKHGLPPQLEYLRSGAERLLEGEFAAHTSKEVYERVVIPVRATKATSGGNGILVVPDVPGEQVLGICRNRSWNHSWEQMISEHCACLLFVRAGSEEIVAPLDWASCHEMYGGVPEAPDGSAEDGGVQSEASTEQQETPEVPTQVVLTEWLQFLRRAFVSVVGGAFRPRIGIVVAAWDAVPADQQAAGPIAYIAANLPLLHQFIVANDEIFEFHVFGVSIVDGDLTNDGEFRERYMNGKPGEFGLVIDTLSGKMARTNDITVPVAWALRLL